MKELTAEEFRLEEEHPILNRFFCDHIRHKPTDSHGHSETFERFVTTVRPNGGPGHEHVPIRRT